MKSEWATAFTYASKYFAETVITVVVLLLISDCGGCIDIDGWFR